MQNRLITTDRLTAWGINVDQSCKLCQGQFESRDHLFMQCSYTQTLWKKLLIWLNRPGFQAQSWGQQENWIVANTKGKSQAAQILKLVYTEFVHVVWQERNQRTFENKSKQWGVLAREIAYVSNVRASLGIRAKLQQLLF
ncbi:uncharacterized protein LOC132637849 [Lycium barbarum]|uniref:uncharacterized protein LOC132637849 n=1 Tax=Lycium barbarum TaxID=112863 RepID=UPI00293E75A1|nr:uncharacterized protein LOC132637849 [Lycium barbarum]